jgi:hypothetical protein
MKAILTEKNIVIVLFAIVFISFSFAQEYFRKLEKDYMGTAEISATKSLLISPEKKLSFSFNYSPLVATSVKQ